MSDLESLREIALDIALAVAPIPTNGQPRVHDARTFAIASKSNHLDLVTELDRATETAILRELLDRRPDDGVLGEEGAAKPSTTGYTWVIDPIDGTVNYFYGLAQWAISIGVVDEHGTPVVGVVHAPALNETYIAARGSGAFLVTGNDRQRLTPPPDCAFELALLTTGFSYDLDRRKDMARVFADFAPRVRDLRRLGAASVDICNVALGRSNGYYERDLKPWDRVAATVVVNEVGVDVSILGDPNGQNLLICAPGQLLAQLTAELARLGVTN